MMLTTSERHARKPWRKLRPVGPVLAAGVALTMLTGAFATTAAAAPPGGGYGYGQDYGGHDHDRDHDRGRYHRPPPRHNYRPPPYHPSYGYGAPTYVPAPPPFVYGPPPPAGGLSLFFDFR